jgi:hypothetical protein
MQDSIIDHVTIIHEKSQTTIPLNFILLPVLDGINFDPNMTPLCHDGSLPAGKSKYCTLLLSLACVPSP